MEGQSRKSLKFVKSQLSKIFFWYWDFLRKLFVVFFSCTTLFSELYMQLNNNQIKNTCLYAFFTCFMIGGMYYIIDVNVVEKHYIIVIEIMLLIFNSSYLACNIWTPYLIKKNMHHRVRDRHGKDRNVWYCHRTHKMINNKITIGKINIFQFIHM